MLSNVLLALASVPVAVAHFALTFPPQRFDTLSEVGEQKYSQWDHPCAGVPYKTGNLTDWPSQGGSLQLELHHNWTYVFVNLGLGANASNFNISLTPEFWNVTGKGTLCVDKLPLPADVQGQVHDGDLASLQVVTVGETGSALYNCADVRLTRNPDAKALPGNCTTSPGMVVQAVKQQNVDGSVNASGNGAAAGNTKGSAGAPVSAHLVGLLTVVVLASAFSLGL
ncbi:hypothetical protein E4U42_006737 [Claviceps africana]|uniref:Copper acquisition factor BIM1-like domain-containing protein n=1 Tax=Claviceps africana TaxID=83212 RepID=A0A8K0NJ34_9HYPO|nr:hypothetical protein E4U42_006737 [Claviceps africana]